ncbi:hypothetical protein J3E74DRAFT_226754, partial [Bipolaris maydis]
EVPQNWVTPFLQSFDRLITKWSAAIDRNKQKADESSNYSIIWRNLCENVRIQHG